MPELPEVETVRRGLEPYLQGSTLKSIQYNRANIRFPLPADVLHTHTGKRITALTRHGKTMIWNFEGARALAWHLGMSGSFRASCIKDAQCLKHDHVVMDTNSDHRIIFNDPRRFGGMTLAPETFKGVDPYTPAYHVDTLYPLFKDRRAPIKNLLLDQTLITGIGNIYACEAVFNVGIDPRRSGASINKRDYARLFEAVKSVLDAAIISGGSSLRDHVMVDGQTGYFQHHFNVYGKAGKACSICSNIIENIKLGGRSSFFCSKCQK